MCMCKAKIYIRENARKKEKKNIQDCAVVHMVNEGNKHWEHGDKHVKWVASTNIIRIK